MYYFVYETKNKLNDKIYIGVHSTTNLGDGYLGSGKRLNNAIKKYGSENFIRTILKFFDNLKDAYKFEKELVNRDFLLRKDIYNLTEGGKGGWEYVNKLQRKNPWNKGFAIFKDKNGKYLRINTEAAKPLIKSGEIIPHTKGKSIFKVNDEYKLIDVQIAKENGYESFSKNKCLAKDQEGNILFLDIEEFNLREDLVGYSFGIKHTNETKEKMKKTFQKNNHQKGNKNSQFGTRWITNGNENKKILKQDIIPNGWRLGRKIK